MKILFLFIGMGLLVPNFLFAQETAPDPQLQTPETLEETKDATLRIGDEIAEELLGIIPNIWRNEVLPAWKAMWAWTKENIWQERLQPAAQRLFSQGRELLGQEVEKRTPIIKEQLQEEKQELADDIAQHGKSAGKGLWERFLDLFREE